MVAGAPNVELAALAFACGLGGEIVAADSGAIHVLEAGHMPDYVIGDMDSIGDARSKLSPATRVESHPRDKNAIDLELALARAARLARNESLESAGPAARGMPRDTDASSEIWVFAAFGGRLDQSIANLLLAAHPEFRGLRITFFDRQQRAWPVLGPDRLSIHGRLGQRVSILPLTQSVRIRETVGLRWSLQDEVLAPGTTRGVSNEMLEDVARIDVADGLALIVHLAEA